MYSLKRLRIYKLFIFFFTAILLILLFKIQIVDGNYYKKRSEDNRIRLIPIKAVRGRIFDRNNIILADNKPSFNLYIIPKDFSDASTSVIAKIINVDKNFIQSKLTSISSKSEKPLLIKKDLSIEKVHKLEELRSEIGGFIISVVGKRYYAWGSTAAHIVGYLGKINKKEYKKKKEFGYMIDDYVGRLGIEYIYDELLHGNNGGKQIEVDAKGKQIQVLAVKEPEQGNDVHLTIDIKLQDKVQKLLKGKIGSVSMMNVNTGEIIVLASSPSFDPNVFVSPGQSDDRLRLLRDKDLPFLNRAISSTYPPGSVFKIVTALAALEKGVITPYTKIECTGQFKLTPNSRPFHCWAKHGHGKLVLEDALKQSCNVYFYKVGKMLGIDAISEFVEKVNLSSPLSIELPNVRKGLFPSREWKKRVFNEKWYQGETLNYSIGQGFLSVTPLQVLRLLSLFASNGNIVEPTIVKDVKYLKHHIALNKRNIDAVKKGMLKAVNDEYGTASVARVDFFKVAGKTGTAQTKGEPHSWFAGFFPYKNPEIAIVVVVEHGGVGGGIAAKIAHKSILYWYDMYKNKDD